MRRLSWPGGTAPTASQTGVVAAVLVVALVLSFVVLGADPRGWFGRSGAQRDNPFRDRVQYVDPEGQGPRAAQAATAAGHPDASLLRQIAAEPTGLWLTPEAVGLDEVEERAATLARAARDRGELALFVLYGIPDRDCSGGYSRGGLEPGDYRTWVERAARGMAAGRGATAAVVEPDALAMLDECANQRLRLELIDHARGALDRAGVTTYLDGGHSDWVPVPQMAERLRAAGVEEARGFAVNVAAYQSEADELAYAERLADALGAGVHYVMDTGRNGAGPGESWCNPSGRALGQRPGAGEGRLDARAWVKPPGESDGTCGGGPAAGTWWSQRAADLARAAGWVS